MPNLNMMVPDDFREEFDRRFSFEIHSYDTVVAALQSYAQQKKFQKFSVTLDKELAKDPNAVDLDMLQYNNGRANEAYEEGIAYCEEEDDSCQYNTGDPSLDALMTNAYQRGRAKGKGKGKGGGWTPKGKGKGDGKTGKTGKGYGPTTAAWKPQPKPVNNPDILCYNCGDKGHIGRICPNPANPEKVSVEKAKVAKARSAGSLEVGYQYESDDDDEVRPLGGGLEWTRLT